MLVTTTPTVEGRTITSYIRVVTGETIVGVNMFRDLGAGLRNLVGGRAKGYEKELGQARDHALGEMCSEAQQLGANAVVGVDLVYETLGGTGMLMVAATGTAVIIQ